MSPEPPGQPSASSNSSYLQPFSVDEQRKPIADIILVGNISRIPNEHDAWGKEPFIWRKEIPGVDVFKFTYPNDAVVTTPTTRTNAITALEKNISKEVFLERSKYLKDVVEHPQSYNRKAPFIILIKNSNIIKGLVLFGTPHFLTGLRQWAHIVIQTTVQPGESSTDERASIAMFRGFRRRSMLTRNPSQDTTHLNNNFKFIAEMQREFFVMIEEGGWNNRMVSCFPMSSSSRSENRLQSSFTRQTIFPQWSTVPNATPVMIRKPYLEMTAFSSREETGFQAILKLIKEWTGQDDKKRTANTGVSHDPRVPAQTFEADQRPGDTPLKHTDNDEDYSAPFKRLETYAASPTELSRFLAPNVRSLPVLSSSPLSDSILESGLAGTPRYHISISSNIVGHWEDIIKLDQYNLPQDLMFSIVLQQDEVSQYCLVEFDVQIDLGAPADHTSTNESHFLMQNYTGSRCACVDEPPLQRTARQCRRRQTQLVAFSTPPTFCEGLGVCDER
ncbi:hypothetical protein F4678DRAFT_459009 [Xylaria arbuscula]|nr:hypothetical protein F4678DRAFT_459009 [Xylaria arbuscula]